MTEALADETQVNAAPASAIRYERDAEGIVTLTMDDPNGSVNLMNEAFSYLTTWQEKHGGDGEP